MAIAVLWEFPNEPIDKYDQGVEKGGDAVRNQPARSIHVCFKMDSGWGVLDVWDSEEDLAKFGEILGPAMQSVGLTMVEPRVFEVHNTM